LDRVDGVRAGGLRAPGPGAVSATLAGLAPAGGGDRPVHDPRDPLGHSGAASAPPLASPPPGPRRPPGSTDILTGGVALRLVSGRAGHARWWRGLLAGRAHTARQRHL